VYAHYDPSVEVVADPSTALGRLADELDREWDVWCADARERVVEHARADPDSGEVTVANALPALRGAMADDDVLVSDVGSHKMTIAQRFPVYEAGHCVVSNGLATMGIGVPGGLAADLAVDSEVVVATGDGGFLMNAAELETAQRLDCAFTTVVFRDDDYGLISEQQTANRGESVGTGLGNPDLVRFAESFGLQATRVDSLDEFAEAVETAVGSDEGWLVDVPLDA
jgi:acetolactate synthase-1/2/3 large subunit